MLRGEPCASATTKKVYPLFPQFRGGLAGSRRHVMPSRDFGRPYFSISLINHLPIIPNFKFHSGSLHKDTRNEKSKNNLKKKNKKENLSSK